MGFRRFFGSSSGPSDKSERDRFILSEEIDNPFPGRPASATPDNAPPKLFGRDEQINKLKEYIQQAAESEERPLIVIQGETGMGKSALTAHLFNKIVQGELDSSQQHVYSAFIEAYGQVKDFGLLLFYQQIIGSLERYSIMPKIAARLAHLIGLSVQETQPQMYRDFFGDWNCKETISATIQRLNDYDVAGEFVRKLLDSINIVYPTIQRKWQQLDPEFVKVILYSQATTMNRVKALNAIKGLHKYENFQIGTDAQARGFLHALIGLFKAVSEKTVLVLFLDQLEELFEISSAKEMATKVFTLLLTLRQVPNTLIVLSGNLFAFNHLMKNISEEFVQQIENWHSYLHIPKLNADEVVDIVYNHLSLMWQQAGTTTSHSHPWYPLSRETIEYLYDKYDMNLRKTLIALHDIFNNFRTEQQVVELLDPIKAIGDLNIIEDPLNIPLNIQIDFRNQLLSDKIQDKQRAQIPEDAIFKLMSVMEKKYDFISGVTTSKSMPSGRRPDIFYQLGGGLFQSDARKVGIEVKCYRQGQVVDRANVEKTVEMLERKELDYVIWITNVILHQDTLEQLSDEIKSRQINTVPLTDEQLAYLYWAYIFEDAMKRPTNPREAETLLEKINIPKLFVSDPTNLLTLEADRKGEEPPAIPNIFNGEAEEIEANPIVPASKPSSAEIEEKEVDDHESVITTPSPSFFDDDEPVKPRIGIDLHDKMRSYILNNIAQLKDDNRKQIKKAQMYEGFLSFIKMTTEEVPEVDFMDIIESLAKTSGEYRTTLKMIILVY